MSGPVHGRLRGCRWTSSRHCSLLKAIRLCSLQTPRPVDGGYLIGAPVGGGGDVGPVVTDLGALRVPGGLPLHLLRGAEGGRLRKARTATREDAHAPPHPHYRPDIDGLRAVAVLAVVGFHAFPDWVKGGFIGVDIFFVISGFLISTIILLGLERDAHSFVDFYARRIRRIFPALVLVLAACFAFGWFALFADEYRQLGKHITGGAGFVSNFVLWWERGYFDAAAETKPLLHLWSLGIEEQYYLVWPLLLWAAWKWRNSVVPMIAGIALASFAYNVYALRTDAIADFYFPQARFWELLAGSLLAYASLRGTRFLPNAAAAADAWLSRRAFVPAPSSRSAALQDLQSVLGTAFIAAGLLLLTRDFGFPGVWALLPVVGAVLIIASGPEAFVNRVVLSHPILVWFGLISFPLYLWHWPLLSFARIVESGSPSAGLSGSLVAGSIALAWLTYRLVERPMRFGAQGRIKAAALLAAMTGVAMAGYATWSGAGFDPRLRAQSDFLDYFENQPPTWHYSFEKIEIGTRWRFECAFFNAQKYREGVVDSAPRASLDPACYERDLRYPKAVLLWGDSYAMQLAPGLTDHLPKEWQFLQVASPLCSPEADTDTPSTTNYCAQSNYFATKIVREAKPDVVVVATAILSPELAAVVAAKVRRLGAGKIVFVGPVPRWSADLPKLVARGSWPPARRTYAGVDRSVLESNAKLMRDLGTSAGVRFVNAIDALCNDDGCLVYLGDDVARGIVSWDEGHLTPLASDYLATRLLVPSITSTR
jgi:peptidoglycan/LPS O-acetylase OafA/YrhL